MKKVAGVKFWTHVFNGAGIEISWAFNPILWIGEVDIMHFSDKSSSWVFVFLGVEVGRFYHSDEGHAILCCRLHDHKYIPKQIVRL